MNDSMFAFEPRQAAAPVRPSRKAAAGRAVIALLLAQLLLANWCTAGIQVEAVPSEELITHITDQELLTLLQEEGYVPKQDKPSVINVKMESINMLFIVSEPGTSIQAWAGFNSKGGLLDKVNEWNKTRRYSRAYIDDANDPVIELDLDLTGGVSKARIVDFIKTARVSVLGFAGFVFAD